MNKPWKLIALLVGIFVAGGATGVAVARRMTHVMPPNRPPPSAEQWSTLHLKRLADEIGVQPAQLEQIRPIVRRGMVELFEMRSHFLADNRARREQMEREVMEVLTPEQRAKYEKINREFRERSQRLERGGAPEGPHRDGERPPPPPRPRDS